MEARVCNPVIPAFGRWMQEYPVHETLSLKYETKERSPEDHPAVTVLPRLSQGKGRDGTDP